MRRIRIIMGDGALVMELGRLILFLDLEGNVWCWNKAARLIYLRFLIVSCGGVAGCFVSSM